MPCSRAVGPTNCWACPTAISDRRNQRRGPGASARARQKGRGKRPFEEHPRGEHIRCDQAWDPAATPCLSLMAALAADHGRVNGGAALNSLVMVTVLKSPIPNRWLSPHRLVDAPKPDPHREKDEVHPTPERVDFRNERRPQRLRGIAELVGNLGMRFLRHGRANEWGSDNRPGGRSHQGQEGPFTRPDPVRAPCAAWSCRVARQQSPTLFHRASSILAEAAYQHHSLALPCLKKRI